MPASRVRGCWVLLDQMLWVAKTLRRLTSSASRAAMRSIGMQTMRNRMDRTANPLAARVLRVSANGSAMDRVLCCAYDDAVIPGEDG